ncbi:NADH dehydrogenase subunit L [Faunimonas pinastri]|uniref:NADH dehydrogenase subunit L n=1 Tax=Faunimonas pinastri TaxID=1855383 RepID=A0A1H9J8X5_9HYPH|nr:NADH-quinone oxidoreductase subunit L [Faunimonas pinastri]SEQ83179.1 NADH dehydrogenase subunit L [Faunimonas pinastri]
MYSAIVFLPLLGAILAGLITIFGAAGRHPGGETGHGDEDHVTDAVGSEHGHGAPSVHGDAAAVHVAHHEPHDHHVPAAVGSRAAEIVTTALLFVSAILSWVAFFRVGVGSHELFTVPVLSWVHSGNLVADWTLRIDTLTVVMLVVVNTVSTLVHLYSIGYMSHDANRPRFFAYLSLFTFAMLMLVTANNFLQMFFGWEGVGLASYLLIGFWYHRPSANSASMKAFIVNRVGDFGFELGIFSIFVLFGSIDFDTVFGNVGAVAGSSAALHIFGHDFSGQAAITVACLLLFMGAMGKSAQVPLHTWLPDAMEGPTPVSALIHAATMVTAGVFMVARLSPIFAFAPTALMVITVIGAFTAFFAATIGLVQNDIKRVIAYSTCSQLGYMFAALGVGAPSVAVFHLFTHAFFKALLFLCAGAVIHAVSDEQDMRKMGGLRKKIPITYVAMIIGTLALTGFPFTAGYYSKDAIIESTYAFGGNVGGFAFVLLNVAAIFTSFYSWRLIFMTFHGAPRSSQEVQDHVHESPQIMLVPLYVLSIGALLAGVLGIGYFVEGGYGAFWKHALVLGEGNEIREAMEHTPFWVSSLPFVEMVIGFLVAFWFYIANPRVPAELAREHQGLHRFLFNKWYFDELYDRIFVRPAMWIGRFLWKRGDGWLIDGLGPNGVSARVLDITNRVVRLQTGYLYHYAFVMLVGVALLVTWMMFTR